VGKGTGHGIGKIGLWEHKNGFLHLSGWSMMDGGAYEQIGTSRFSLSFSFLDSAMHKSGGLWALLFPFLSMALTGKHYFFFPRGSAIRVFLGGS